ncbi:MAG: gas vesicle protein K [Ignavibacteria bacterium]
MNEDKVLYGTEDMEVLTAQLETLNAITDSRLNVNADNVDSGLAKLVLTLIELIRKLIEKQAMRRVEGGTLTDEEIERLGETLMKLENKMEELKKYFNLSDRDLNINLGPLGDLM